MRGKALERLTDFPLADCAVRSDIGEHAQDALTPYRARWERIDVQAPVILAHGLGALFHLHWSKAGSRAFKRRAIAWQKFAEQSL